MEYTHIDQNAVVEGMVRQRAEETAWAAWQAELDVAQARKLEASSERYKQLRADRERELAKREERAERIEAANGGVVDLTRRQREWLSPRLAQLEAEHLAHHTMAENPDLYEGTQGFQGVEFHRRACTEIEAAWQVASGALAGLGDSGDDRADDSDAGSSR